MKSVYKLLKKIFLKYGFRISRVSSDPWGIDMFNDLNRLYDNSKIICVFDVGANVGQSRDIYLEKFPNAKVYSFEPVKSTFHVLKESRQEMDRSICFNIAFGSSLGKAIIQLQEKSTMNSMSKERIFRSKEVFDYEEVDVEMIDHFADSLSLESVDFLKIDTEGFEMEVLKGGANFLKSGKVKFILLELGAKSYHRTTYYNNVQEYLACLGYDVMGYYKQSQSLYTKSRFLMHSDVLFINAEWSKTLRPKFVKSFEYD